MQPEPTVVPDDHIDRWKVAVSQIRTSAVLLSRMIDPRPGSGLAVADSLYPSEKASAWARSYLDAGCEHLNLWADLVAPAEFDANTVNNVAYRPYLLLARAGLESVAHGLWLLDVEDSAECVGRHVRMMHRDIGYFIKARRAGQLSVSKIEDQQKTLVDRASEALPTVTTTDKPPGYENIVRYAATAQEQDPDRWAYLWNLASGAGHGQNWFSLEGYLLAVGDEYEPGYYRVARRPDVELLTETVEAGAATLRYATLLWAGRAGYPYREMYVQAMCEVIDRMPTITGQPRSAET
ncbi:hypothetical protein [[Mycobacterium] crassicus]|uniref:Uncharacterized protein n=1 Tax=[Mycobacterium] crassicus TaxID=2872309 RepID=A0ABU5XNM8_9MYCO|nr:hypothetical protein [Mycolicibacter sp. MYC098]MEB3023613.1 hypothetical protein [Mycolicibacter sp. MYC098]